MPKPKIKRSERQQEAYKILKLHPTGTGENLLNLAGVETATLKALEKKGICECVLAEQDFSPMPMSMAQMPLTANPEQKKAIDSVLKARKKYQAFLLDGLTGSGKTEVYLQIMQEVLKTRQTGTWFWYLKLDLLHRPLAVFSRAFIAILPCYIRG